MYKEILGEMNAKKKVENQERAKFATVAF